MAAVDNHYEFLGLEPTASQAEIEAAIEKISEQAISLVYSSPQRSADLWERIRHMRRDLLATPEGRQVYDEALRRTETTATRGRTAPLELRPAFRQAEVPTRPAALPAGEAPRLVAVEPTEEKEDSRGIAWPYALVAAAAVLVAVAGALVAREPGVTPARRPVAMTLSQLGALHGTKFVSGGSVKLTWTKVPHASMYRLQITTAPGVPSDAAVFAHGSRTISVTKSTYTLRVTGSQLYYWRVQARVGKTWQRYSPSQHFAVAKPVVTMPVALAPVTGIAKGGKHARLCWSAVAHADGYRLRVQGQPTRTVSGTCVTLSVQPRSYRWSVAALVKGAGVYTGAYSVAAVLHVEPTQHAAHRTHASHHSMHRATQARKASKRHTSKTGYARGNSVSAVEVAVAMPGPRLITTGTKRTALHRSIATVRGSAARANRSRKAASRGKRTVYSVATSAVTSRRTPARASNSGTSSYVPRPPATPIKTRTPVVSSTAGSTRPTAPPPPPPPASHPTRVIAATKSPTASTGIVVRPVVAAQIPTRSSASPTSTRPTLPPASPGMVTYSLHPATATTSAPQVGSTGPMPTSTKAAVPTSTSHGKPDNVTHPVHPVHPDHPAHP